MNEEAMIADLKPASSLIDDQCEAIELCRDGPQPLDRRQKAARTRVHGQERRNSHGADGGGINGRWDADRYDGGGGSVLSGFFQRMAGLGARAEIG